MAIIGSTANGNFNGPNSSPAFQSNGTAIPFGPPNGGIIQAGFFGPSLGARDVNTSYQLARPNGQGGFAPIGVNDGVLLDFSDKTTGVTLTGGLAGDVLIGGSANDILSGNFGIFTTPTSGSGPDTITGGGGNDEIAVSDPNSVVVYSGARSDYTVTTLSSPIPGRPALQISDNRTTGSNDGTDTVLGAAGYYQFSDGIVAAANILSNDPVYSLSLDKSQGPEGTPGGGVGTVYTFTVTRSGDTTRMGGVSLDFGGTATGPLGGNPPLTGTADYSFASGIGTFGQTSNTTGVLTIPAGQASATFTVTSTPDATVEPDETLIVTLTGVVIGVGSIGSIDSATATITNDDAAPTLAIGPATLIQPEGNSGQTAFSYTVTRTGNASADETVNYAVTGTGQNPATASDFVGNALPSGVVTFSAGQTTQTVLIPVMGDSGFESDEGFTVTLSSPNFGTITQATATGTITNDDVAPTLAIGPATIVQPEGNSGQAAFSYTVTRTGDAQANETVNYAVTGTGPNPATASDFVGNALPSGVVTFAQGQTTQTVLIPVMGDSDFEGDEGFTVTLSSPNFGTITQATATGTITNDDAAPTLAIGPATLVQPEGNSGQAAFSYTVTRTGDAQADETVNYAVTGSGQNQAAASDFVGNAFPSGVVTFAQGQTTQTILVPVLGDNTFENDEGFTVTLSGPSFGTITQGTATGTITNDDAAPTLAIGPATLVQPEGNSGQTAFSYTVTRTGDAQANETVNYAVTGTGPNPATASDFVGNALPSGVVTFSAGQTTQTVLVPVMGDSVFESDEGFTVTLSGPNFGTITQATATGTITNDDPSTTQSAGPDLLSSTPGDDIIAGLGGNDTISGGAGNDLLYGNQGNDSIDAGSGNNSVYGGMGDDIISAGSGNDLIFGNEGADTINAGGGNNTVVGGQDSTDGADVITTGAGNDLIYGNGGDDSIAAGAGQDIVVGGYGNDVLFGNEGNDLIYANQGNDSVFGGSGDDTLIGGQGDDTINGGEGNDVIYGNEGADRIVFGINSGNDIVMDFSQSDGDRLDLQGQTYTTTTDASGNAVLTLSGGGAITLAGIAASQVNAGVFA